VISSNLMIVTHPHIFYISIYLPHVDICHVACIPSYLSSFIIEPRPTTKTEADIRICIELSRASGEWLVFLPTVSMPAARYELRGLHDLWLDMHSGANHLYFSMIVSRRNASSSDNLPMQQFHSCNRFIRSTWPVLDNTVR
jgi:hypothetical protein